MEYKKEILDLKVEVMLQRIDRLCNIYTIVYTSNCKQNHLLDIIKKEYLRMYNKLKDRKEFDKYKQIEDIVIKQVSKLELELQEYIYDNVQRYQQVIKNSIQNVKKSENYENFHNMEEEMNKIESLKDLLKLYRPYINEVGEEEIQHRISELKFNILFRKQVEELIYQSEGNESNLVQYDSQTEKAIFERLLEEKINLVKQNCTDSMIENDELFKMPTEQILSNSNLLERLIIIDMRSNPYEYINLLKAKIFNAHLCNIANNPYEESVYLTERQLEELGFFDYQDPLSTNRVNYSLLNALLKSVITDENISIVDCGKIYKKFGFKCNPILVNTGQQCIKMIYEDVKNSKKFISFLLNEEDKKSEQEEKLKEGEYCEIDFCGLKYYFYDDKYSEDLFSEIINKRKIEAKPISTKKNRKMFLKSQEGHTEDEVNDKKRKVKKEVI